MMKLVWILALFAIAVASNPEEEELDPDTFEGDMILTPEQMANALSGGDIDASTQRGATKGRHWPGGVFVYQIDSSLARDSRAMGAIEGAFREWSSKTCIKFKKRTTEQAYAYFQMGSGCSSYVGRTGKKQTINLAKGCWYMGIVAHEIGHALGFYHEQSRPDRDTYVTIMWNNIVERSKFNFNKYDRSTIDSLRTEYDYGSVMHYSGKSFSKNGQPTIVSRQPGKTLGQRERLSVIDAKQMNLLYKSQCNGGGGGGGGSNCLNNDRRCGGWKSYCSNNHYVKKNCKKTCNLC